VVGAFQRDAPGVYVVGEGESTTHDRISFGGYCDGISIVDGRDSNRNSISMLDKL